MRRMQEMMERKKPKEVGSDCHSLLPTVLTAIVSDYKEDFDSPIPINMPTALHCAQYTLFGKPFLNMQKTKLMIRFGESVLRGEKIGVDVVLEAVAQDPELLNTVITVKDPLGTPFTGTLIQLAAMAGDVNFQSEITNENQGGLVERLIEAGRIVSNEEIAAHMQCVNSDDAKTENNARIQRYLDIVQKFGNALYVIDRAEEDEIVAQFERELKEERQKAVTAGLAFDPKILNLTAKWYASHAKNFGGWETHISDVFWNEGFGKLQSLLSSRDAQVARMGVRYVVDENQIPIRALQAPEGEAYFYNTQSRLGHQFYLDELGEESDDSNRYYHRYLTACNWEKYVDKKRWNPLAPMPQQNIR